jgi:hypothetical protein
LSIIHSAKLLGGAGVNVFLGSPCPQTSSLGTTVEPAIVKTEETKKALPFSFLVPPLLSGRHKEDERNRE